MRRSIGTLAIAGALFLAIPIASVQASPGLGVAFDVQTTLGNPSSGPFTATGVAVNRGVVCADGWTIDVGVTVTGANNRSGGATYHVLKDFVCNDGSGSFLLKFEVRADDSRSRPYSWMVAGGTGAYSHLAGSGSGYSVAADYGINDRIFGNVH